MNSEVFEISVVFRSDKYSCLQGLMALSGKSLQKAPVIVGLSFHGCVANFREDEMQLLGGPLQAAIASNCSLSVGAGLKAKRLWRLRIM